MGGKALGFEARRISSVKLAQIHADISARFPGCDVMSIPYYRNKPDHGDVDLVVTAQNYGIVRDAVMLAFNNPVHYDNNPILSFAYEDDIQVDLIVCRNHAEAQMYVNYFAWNDLGNFFGRVARSLGFKYGHDGLTYVLRLSDHHTEIINVTSDMRIILPFLGYDYETWRRGFAEKEDVFAYAASSKAFNAQYFSLEDQAHQDRVRNKKRAMYQAMLEYIETNNILPKPKFDTDQRDLMVMHMDLILRAYGSPTLSSQIEQRRVLYDQSVAAKERFNGNLVREWTGLDGKELGAVVTKFKTYYGACLQTNTADQIKQDFISWHLSSNPNPQLPNCTS